VSFYGLLSKYYDDIFPANKDQIDFLTEEMAGCQTLIDIGAGTGNAAVSLVRLGHNVAALEYDNSMSEQIREKNQDVSVITGDMRKLNEFFSAPFDGAYCIGNTLVHLSDVSEISEVLAQIAGLLPSGAPLVLQLVNYDRILTDTIDSLPTIKVPSKKLSFHRGYELEGNRISFTGTLVMDGQSFSEKTLLYPLTSGELTKLLQEDGFTDISLYGDFKRSPYSKENSPALIAVARKGY
jgi:SAM-dependent methyltransferase